MNKTWSAGPVFNWTVKYLERPLVFMLTRVGKSDKFPLPKEEDLEKHNSIVWLRLFMWMLENEKGSARYLALLGFTKFFISKIDRDNYYGDRLDKLMERVVGEDWRFKHKNPGRGWRGVDYAYTNT